MGRTGQSWLRPNGLVPPIGAVPLVLWDARQGVSHSAGVVSSWADIIRGLVLDQPTVSKRPTFAADGADFTRSVVQFDGSDDTLRVLGASPVIFPSGTYPHWFYVFRLRVAPGPTRFDILDSLDAPQTVSLPQSYISTTPVTWYNSFYPVSGASQVYSPGTSTHVLQTWAPDAVNPACMSVDGGSTTVGSGAPGTLAACASLYVASTRDQFPAPLSLAALGCYGAPLTATQRAALVTYYQRTWIPVPPPPLPSTAVEYWQSDRQCTSTAWTGQKRGVVLTTVSAATVGGDGTFFGGRPVAQTSDSTSNNYKATGISPALATAGTYPYVFLVLRMRVVPASNRYLYDIGGPTGSSSDKLETSVRTDFGEWYVLSYNNTQFTGVPYDTNVHVFEQWTEAAGTRWRLDGVSAASTATNLSAPMDWNTVSLGSLSTSSLGPAASFAFALICTAKPSDSEITALRAWATAYWGAPP